MTAVMTPRAASGAATYPYLPSIALAKSSAVNEEEDRCLSRRPGREVQIEPLLRVLPVAEVQRVR